MKLKENVRLVDLISKSKLCKEDVLFKTDDGDILNMKSFLSALLLQTLANDRYLLATGKIVCMNDDDYKILGEFLEEA